MNLEAARELKAAALRELEQPDRWRERLIPSLHLGATPLGHPALHVELPWQTVAGGLFAGAPRLARRRRRPAPPKVALGIARGSGEGDYALAVRVQEAGLLESDLVRGLHERADGALDVRYIGRAMPLGGSVPAGIAWARDEHRPLAPGTSLGSRHGETTGTLGAFVRPRSGGGVGILSNNHVLADQDRAPDRARAIQPGWDDGGREPASAVAALSSAVKLDRRAVNQLDCAVATLSEGVEWDPSGLPGGPLTGVGEPDLDLRVKKVGRTTGETTGVVAAIETGPVRFEYPIGPLVFDSVFEVHGVDLGPFGRRGDSGAVVFSETGRRAVGLLFGATTTGGANGAGVTYVCPLPAVLEALKIDLLV